MQKQSLAIIKALVSVAWADGNFSDKEREMLDALLEAFEASEEQATELRAYAAEKRTMDDVPVADLEPGDRLAVIQHAVYLSFLDGEQDETERAFIDALCKKLEIGEAEAEMLVIQSTERAKRHLAEL